MKKPALTHPPRRALPLLQLLLRRLLPWEPRRPRGRPVLGSRWLFIRHRRGSVSSLYCTTNAAASLAGAQAARARNARALLPVRVLRPESLISTCSVPAPRCFVPKSATFVEPGSFSIRSLRERIHS